jgi:predicted DNA-binding transcriptional regulator AlpA
MSRDTLEKKWKKGEFPEPIVVTSGYYVWLESEIEAFIQDRAQNARAGKLRGVKP